MLVSNDLCQTTPMEAGPQAIRLPDKAEKGSECLS